MEKSKTILFVIGIILIGIIIINAPQKPKEELTLKVHYYNNGVEVFPEKNLFSVVIGGGGDTPGAAYDKIAFEITGKNTGNMDITNMKVAEAKIFSSGVLTSSLAFKNAIPTNIQTLTRGQTKLLWKTADITTAQFEGMAQPIRFLINVTGDSGADKVSSRTYIDLMISSEGLIIFRTNVDQSLLVSPYSPANRYIDSFYHTGDTTDGKLKWIAFDKDENWVMEKYGITSSVSESNRHCDNLVSNNVLLYMPFGRYECSTSNEQHCDVWILNNSQTDKIGLCYNIGAETAQITGASVIRWWSTTSAGAENAIITNTSIEPFRTNKQERYYALKLAKFRTSTKTLSNLDHNLDSIAWNIGCSPVNNMVVAGEYEFGGVDLSNSYTCLTYMPKYGYTKILDIAPGVITSLTRGSNVAIKDFSLWKYSDYSYALCGMTNTRPVYNEFRTNSEIVGQADNLVSYLPYRMIPPDSREMYC